MWERVENNTCNNSNYTAQSRSIFQFERHFVITKMYKLVTSCYSVLKVIRNSSPTGLRTGSLDKIESLNNHDKIIKCQSLFV